MDETPLKLVVKMLEKLDILGKLNSELKEDISQIIQVLLRLMLSIESLQIEHSNTVEKYAKKEHLLLFCVNHVLEAAKKNESPNKIVVQYLLGVREQARLAVEEEVTKMHAASVSPTEVDTFKILNGKTNPVSKS